MTEKTAPPLPTLRNRVSTGYGRLDDALKGGFLPGTAIVLSAPASDEVPILLRRFLEADTASLLISRSLSSAEPILSNKPDGLKCLVCSDKPVPPSQNTLPGKGIENLTELSLTITETINSVKPNRLVIQFLSDVLLRHKTLQTRKWLGELLDKLRAKNITTLVVLNPYMHSGEEVQAIVDLFNGDIELIEKPQVEGQLRKALVIKWMHGVETTEKEFPLTGLTPEPQIGTEPVTVTPASLREPRWLTPLVSRTAEMDRLKIAFEDALQDKSSVVALQGEAGIGKSRLMLELVTHVSSKGAVVLSGRASQDPHPYGPWIEIARQYVSQAPGELLRRMLGANASELVKLVPDVAVKLGTIPPPRTGGQQDKSQFYEAVTQFFIAISKGSPLLLLLDDAQYLDQSSAELWEYLVRSTSNLQILTVCSTPPEIEIDPNSQLGLVLTRFNKERLLETVPLRGLDRDETATLIKETFGEQTVSPEFADLIYQHTGGNPFFVEEVLRSLVADGTIFRTEKGWDRKPIQDIVVPKTIKTALKARLSKLDPQAMSTLEWAAMMGSEFDFDVLREASQVSEDKLLEQIGTAVSQGLLEEVPNEQSRVRFADDRIRQMLREELIQLKRRRYHLKIAQVMEKAYADSLENHAEDIAAHFSESGDKGLTVKYSIMAGDRNRSIHAYQLAISNYERALDLIDPERDAQVKPILLEKLADSLYFAGRVEQSTMRFEEVLSIFEKQQNNEACARICRELSENTFRAKGDVGGREAVQLLKRAAKYLETAPQSSEAASVYEQLAYLDSVIDEYEEAKIWVERALEVGEKTENLSAVIGALSTKGSLLTDLGKIDEGLPILEKALKVATDHSPDDSPLFLLSIYTYPRDMKLATEYGVRRLANTERLNSIIDRAYALSWLSMLNWLSGDWKMAVQRIQESAEIQKRVGSRTVFVEALRGMILLSRGDLKTAEAAFQSASDLLKSGSNISEIVQFNLGLGLFKLEQDQISEATTHFETGADAFRKWEFTTLPLWHIETLLCLASTRVKSTEIEKAHAAAEWASRLAEQLKSDAGMAMALQAEAIVLRAKGDNAGAVDNLERCLILWDKAGWPCYRAKALVEYAETIAKASPEESNIRLEEAAEIFRKLGAKRDLEKAEAAIQKS